MPKIRLAVSVACILFVSFAGFLTYQKSGDGREAVSKPVDVPDSKAIQAQRYNSNGIEFTKDNHRYNTEAGVSFAERKLADKNSIERSPSIVIQELSALDGDISELFLDIVGAVDIENLDRASLKLLDEEISDFFVDHNIIKLINDGRIDGDDREAMSRVFEYTTLLRAKISQQGIAKLRSEIDLLKQDVNSGRLPMPEPMSLAQRQAIERQVKENYEVRISARNARRQKEDEALDAEELAINK